MAKTVFTSEQVKELSLQQGFAFPAAFYAVLSWFTKYLLMGYRPGNTGNGDGQQYQPEDLHQYSHQYEFVFHTKVRAKGRKNNDGCHSGK